MLALPKRLQSLPAVFAWHRRRESRRGWLKDVLQVSPSVATDDKAASAVSQAERDWAERLCVADPADAAERRSVKRRV